MMIHIVARGGKKLLANPRDLIRTNKSRDCHLKHTNVKRCGLQRHELIQENMTSKLKTSILSQSCTIIRMHSSYEPGLD